MNFVKHRLTAAERAEHEMWLREWENEAAHYERRGDLAAAAPRRRSADAIRETLRCGWCWQMGTEGAAP